MRKTEFLEIIHNGENSGVEFKRDDIRPEQLAKEIVALANLKGGYILIGYLLGSNAATYSSATCSSVTIALPISLVLTWVQPVVAISAVIMSLSKAAETACSIAVAAAS